MSQCLQADTSLVIWEIASLACPATCACLRRYCRYRCGKVQAGQTGWESTSPLNDMAV